MVWILLTVLTVWLIVAVPAFRKVLAVLIGILVLIAIAFFGWLQYQETRTKQEAEAAKQRIRPAEVDLIDLRMGLAGPSVTLAGRVRNNHPSFTITALELRLIIEECDANRRCDIVGDEREFVSTEVPPGQVRDLTEHPFFDGLGAERPNRGWRYEVVSVSGR